MPYTKDLVAAQCGYYRCREARFALSTLLLVFDLTTSQLEHDKLTGSP